VVYEKYEMFGAQTKHSSLFLKLFSERRSIFYEKIVMLFEGIIGIVGEF
jgi:hypothetical protein